MSDLVERLDRQMNNISDYDPSYGILIECRREIERLQDAKRRALQMADERAKENEAMRAALRRIDAINDSPAYFNREIDELCRPHLHQQVKQ